MFKASSVLMGIVAFVSVSAFAGGPGTPLSWDDFKKACTDYQAFGMQQPPQNIQIICSDVHTTWVPEEPQMKFDLPGKRVVTAAVTSDKANVSPITESIAAGTEIGSCTKFKEVVQTYQNPPYVVSCNELVGSGKGKTDGGKGGIGDESLTQFCADQVSKGKSENPKLVSQTDTGNVLNNCPADATPITK